MSDPFGDYPIGRYATRIEIKLDTVTVDFLPETFKELNEIIQEYHLNDNKFTVVVAPLQSSNQTTKSNNTTDL